MRTLLLFRGAIETDKVSNILFDSWTTEGGGIGFILCVNLMLMTELG